MMDGVLCAELQIDCCGCSGVDGGGDLTAKLEVFPITESVTTMDGVLCAEGGFKGDCSGTNEGDRTAKVEFITEAAAMMEGEPS